MDGQPAEVSQGFASSVSQVTADKGIRVAGYFLDVLPTLLVIFVAWIPIIGLMLAGLILLPYWLLRDVMGASLGKLLLGLKVIGKDGQPATAGARILRNVPLIFGPACALIPFLGYIFAGPVAFIVTLVEEPSSSARTSALATAWPRRPSSENDVGPNVTFAKAYLEAET